MTATTTTSNKTAKKVAKPIKSASATAATRVPRAVKNTKRVQAETVKVVAPKKTRVRLKVAAASKPEKVAEKKVASKPATPVADIDLAIESMTAAAKEFRRVKLLIAKNDPSVAINRGVVTRALQSLAASLLLI